MLIKPYVKLNNADWTKNATIYQLNTRQFSAEGNFNGIFPHLPRLKEMGIDIIWLMPIHPIGMVNRKGSLGSYYSVKDYYGINEEFGNQEDYKKLVDAIHGLGMKVIIDWVANHTSWDNDLVKLHPDWYLKDKMGNFQNTPWRDYDDIVELDYSKPELWHYMTEAMMYWVKEFDIDGFRCDVADFVPIDFWEFVRKSLGKIKPVFMLAEAENRELHRKAFDATYTWHYYNITKEIANGKPNIKALTEGYLAEHLKVYPKEAMRMYFTDNHDKNSWEGNAELNFGASLETFIVLGVLMDGIPLVYNGQEAGLNRSLQFFDRDPIEWKSHQFYNLYKSLFELKHQNKALWNGKWGGEMQRLNNSKMDIVLSFVREKEGYKIIAMMNLSPNAVKVTVNLTGHSGIYQDWRTKQSKKLKKEELFNLKPWEYKVYFI